MLWIIMVLFSQIINAQQLRQTCADQLFDYYVSQGLSPAFTPQINPIIITRFAGGIEISFSFESVAGLYQGNTPGLEGLLPPIVDYISFSRPFCVNMIELTCGATLLNNLPKNESCKLIDYDVHAPVVAGRTFVYNPEAGGIPVPGGCSGDIVVRLFGDLEIGTDFDGRFNESFYTYAIPDRGPLLNFSAATAEYQSSLCLITPTAEVPAPPPGQFQLVCLGTSLGCVQKPRPGLNFEILSPLPTFACVGPVPGLPNGSYMVWQVTLFAQGNGLNPLDNYCIKFCAARDPACLADNTTLQCRIGFPGTRAQFISPFSSFDSVAILYYNGNNSYTRPIYIHAVTDPYVRDIPCICGLTIDCHAENATIDLTTTSKVLAENNAPPQATPLENPVFILPGVQNVSLSLALSRDGDNQPNLLSYFWEVYNTTPTAVTIDNPFSVNITVSGDFVLGVYRFIGRVSDGQLTNFVIVNVSVQLNAIFVVLTRYIEVQFRPITVCPPPGELPALSDAIALNGSASFELNRGIPLVFNWTQISGSNITVPFSCDPLTVRYLPVEAFFNTNESIAYFVPPALGLYTFRLTICDNNTSPCRFQDIHVSVELNFDGPNSTRNNYTDYPDAPIFNVSNRSVPIITFPPRSEAPFQRITRPPSFIRPPVNTQPPETTVPSTTGAPTPFVPINIPGLFPRLPPPSGVEKASLFLVFVTVIAMLVLLLGFYVTEARAGRTSRWDRIKVYQ